MNRLRMLTPEEECQREAEEANRCRATRGPRSTVECERQKGHADDDPEFPEHIGRGRAGQWFLWRDDQ